MRLPSGQLIELIVDKEEAVQYLFDYVSSLEKEDIGFENEPVRKFDIVRPFDRLYLMGRKHERLAVVFADSDSENLAVLELS